MHFYLESIGNNDFSSFFSPKVWFLQISFLLLPPQFGNEGQTSTDVPWCNGSTRVFGSLSHRSNRCGTTSPSLEPCGSIPIFTQDSFLQLCLYDTAFFCFLKKREDYLREIRTKIDLDCHKKNKGLPSFHLHV